MKNKDVIFRSESSKHKGIEIGEIECENVCEINRNSRNGVDKFIEFNDLKRQFQIRKV